MALTARELQGALAEQRLTAEHLKTEAEQERERATHYHSTMEDLTVQIEGLQRREQDMEAEAAMTHQRGRDLADDLVAAGSEV